MKKKLYDLEEKLEIEKFRRENALMTNMNKYQDKINTYIVKNEEREKKRQKALLKAEKEKEKKLLKKNNHFNEVRENIKNNEKINETKRRKLIEEIEKKDLKDYAIKQEKKKLFEERMRMNKLNKEERDALKLRIQAIINHENNSDEDPQNQEILNKLLNENNNKLKNDF